MKRDRDKIYIYGKHALTEALQNAPHVVKKVFLSNEVDDARLRELLKKRGVPVTPMKTREADQMVGSDTAHQGVIAIADPSGLMRDFDDFEKTLKPDASTALVLLDELTDPHNVGAIIRSAAAFGAAGVLIPFYRQAPITGAVIKSSAGMAFRIPLISIGNVNQTIDRLKDMLFVTYGLAMNGEQNVLEEPFKAPTLFIVGNEGKGIREKTLERCDVKLRVPMNPRAESLNASVSAAIVLYSWSAKHPEALSL